jgi:CBS domain-containing protein
MHIKDIMTRSVECISSDASIREAAEKMRNLNVGTLPVMDRDRLVGMITDRDITVRAVAQGIGGTVGQVRDVMTPEIMFCFENEEVSNAAQLMKERKVRRLIVLDVAHKLVGILSLGDLAVLTHDDELSGNTLSGVSEPIRPRGKGNGNGKNAKPCPATVPVV